MRRGIRGMDNGGSRRVIPARLTPNRHYHLELNSRIPRAFSNLYFQTNVLTHLVFSSLKPIVRLLLAEIHIQDLLVYFPPSDVFRKVRYRTISAPIAFIGRLLRCAESLKPIGTFQSSSCASKHWLLGQ